MEIIVFMHDALAVGAAGHNAHHTCAAARAGPDLQVIGTDKLDFMSRFRTFFQYFLQHYVCIGHFSAK